jgi:CheY-like chemotaxis protein
MGWDVTITLYEECPLSTWMVVEDEPDIYEVLLAMFEVWGIEGVAFVDGSEAVAWIDDVDAGRVQSELPELAILDIRLPEVSGPEVGSRLRKSPRLKHIAIILITAYRLKPDEEDQVIEQAQADLLLYKPLPHPDEFRSILEQALEKRAALAAKAAEQDAIETPVEEPEPEHSTSETPSEG